MNILNNFDINANFWKINPQLIIMEEFKELYNSDKSKDHNASSKIMWAIALILDTESKYWNLPMGERKKIIAKDYLKNTNFKFEDYKVQCDAYEKLTITAAKRQLIEWSRIMDEKSEVLRGMKYNTSTWETIEKMLISNKALFVEFERISEMLIKEGGQGLVKGGAVESASESGDI